MKVVILAGGLPSKLIEEDEKIPKPMAEIGGRPILWHIMKQYAHYGYNDFIICGGYKVEMIKEYFMNFYIYQSDITVDLSNNDVIVHNKKTEEWTVTVVDTGFRTSIPQRLKLIQEYLEGNDFIVSYGDCVSDININELVSFHNENSCMATLAVAKPNGRNVVLPVIDGKFKPREIREENAWVNACNMVCKNSIYSYIEDNMVAEEQLFNLLMENGDAVPYIHNGFWSPMETVRDKMYLQNLWDKQKAPWKVWKE